MRLIICTLSAVRYSPRSAPGIVSTTRNDLLSGDPSGLSVPRRISAAGVSVRRSPATVFAGKVKVIWTASPACCAATSLMATGMGGEGGVGSPGAPHPAASNKSRNAAPIPKRKIRGRRIQKVSGFREFRFSIFEWILQYVPAQILVFHDFGELLVHIRRINFHVFLLKVGSLEGKLVENFFKNGVQAASANVFCRFVDAGREFGDGIDGVVGDIQLHAFGLEQRNVLLDQRILGLGKDADKIFFLQRLQLDANR